MPDADTPIRLLHLSDLHFRAAGAWDADPILRGLVSFVAAEIVNGLTPDFVAITGDLAHTGDPKEYALAETWLANKLWPALGLDFPRDRLLLVPGNHDVDRRQVDFPALAIQSALLAGGDQRQVTSFLSADDQAPIILKRHSAYLQFCSRWFGSPQPLPWWQRPMEIRGCRLHFAGLNSAWMAGSNSDYGRLLLGRFQLAQTVEAEEAKYADWRVALMHHPWHYLAEFDVRSSIEVVGMHCDILLRGHLHEAQPAFQIPSDPSRACLELSAGSLYSSSAVPNTFQWVELSPRGKRVRVLYRVWKESFWTIDRNQPGCPEGWVEFNLSATQPPPSMSVDFGPYLEAVYKKTAHIDIRGLATGQAHRSRRVMPDKPLFPIEELYIDLAASSATQRARKLDKARESEVDANDRAPVDRRSVSLLRYALRYPRLVIVGDPGSGKSTFLRWIAHCLAGDRLGREPGSAERLGLDRARLPLIVPVGPWLDFIQSCTDRKEGSHFQDGSQWLIAYLERVVKDSNLGLSADDLRGELHAGKCVILLDGLDEASDTQQGQRAVGLIKRIAAVFEDCPMVVTTRPAAYHENTVLTGFYHARIESLDAAAVDGFLARWSRALFPESTQKADLHWRGLAGALASRPEIRRMARNMLMLTALAVMHWNENRLPERRVELFEAILRWLLESRDREGRPHRPTPSRCRQLLSELALAMQSRQVHVSRRWAAEQLQARFGGGSQGIDQAEAFLEEVEIDSGIIVRRGSQLRFWHLTFQEYLAAQALAGRPDHERLALLLGSTCDELAPLYRPEWREIVLLLGGVLYLQGGDKIDGLIDGVLKALGDAPTRAEQARAAGLLGALVRDLEPFGYRVSNSRYDVLLAAALAVFDHAKAASISVRDRIAAADALALAGDPRLGWTAPGRWVSLAGGRLSSVMRKFDAEQASFDTHATDFKAPVHLIVVGDFRIARYPVTVAEYAEFLEDEDHANPRWWWAGGADHGAEPDEWDYQQLHPSRPVVNVTWFQAMAFCAWLTERLASLRSGAGQSMVSAGLVVRLPTEAESEFAARGETSRRYPWGDGLPNPDMVNYHTTGIGHATPVGVFPGDVTPEGVSDMAGNVAEWCLDASEEIPSTHHAELELMTDVRALEHEESRRIVRGGSFISALPQLKSTSLEATEREAWLGFRCVLARPQDVDTLAELQARELEGLGRLGRFQAAFDLLTRWLSDPESLNPLLLQLQDAARFLSAASATTIPGYRLRHIEHAGHALERVGRERQDTHRAIAQIPWSCIGRLGGGA